MTLVATAIILTFTGIEFFDYRRIGTDTSLVVDKSRGEKLTVHMDVTFPRVPCYCQSIIHNLLSIHLYLLLQSTQPRRHGH